MSDQLPQSPNELSVADIELLTEAIRTAVQLPPYIHDPKTSFRLGWILGMLRREALKRN